MVYGTEVCTRYRQVLCVMLFSRYPASRTRTIQTGAVSCFFPVTQPRALEHFRQVLCHNAHSQFFTSHRRSRGSAPPPPPWHSHTIIAFNQTSDVDCITVTLSREDTKEKNRSSASWLPPDYPPAHCKRWAGAIRVPHVATDFREVLLRHRPPWHSDTINQLSHVLSAWYMEGPISTTTKNARRVYCPGIKAFSRTADNANRFFSPRK